VSATLLRRGRPRLICPDGCVSDLLEVVQYRATGRRLLVASRTTLAGRWHDGAVTSGSASVATSVRRGVADLSVSASDQSCARDLVSRTCRTRSRSSAAAV